MIMKQTYAENFSFPIVSVKTICAQYIIKEALSIAHRSISERRKGGRATSFGTSSDFVDASQSTINTNKMGIQHSLHYQIEAAFIHTCPQNKSLVPVQPLTERQAYSGVHEKTGFTKQPQSTRLVLLLLLFPFPFSIFSFW